MAARRAMIVGGRRVGRRNRIPQPPKWNAVSEDSVQIITSDGLILNDILDYSLVQSQELNTIKIPGIRSSYIHYGPTTTKVKRNKHNKNMRRYHRVHQPGFDTQRRPIKN